MAGHGSGAFVDLHVHSTCSGDGHSSIARHTRRAALLGLAEVGFCEHVDFDPRDRDFDYLDPAHYDQEMAKGRKLASGVKLRQGVEITYQSSREDEIRTWLAGFGWDYVVTSVHLVDYADGWAVISDPETAAAYFAAHSARQAYLPYFEELLRAARSGLGDVLGHLDLVKRYGTAHHGPFDPAVFEDEIRAVLRAAVEAGVGIEINTSGLRQSPAAPYPSLPVLRWYRELGGEILTIGSDAHHAGHLAAGIEAALDLARVAGFSAITTFAARRTYWIDL